MEIRSGTSSKPLLILHGGAGPQDPDAEKLRHSTEILIAIGKCAVNLAEKSSVEVVVECLEKMELAEEFNAGYGAALQSDGQARLTAALMDGEAQSFSGVIAATHLRHPSQLAKELQKRSSRVLTYPGVDLLARELGVKVESALMEPRVMRWVEAYKNSKGAMDTVGCVALNSKKHLAAGTSTGGRGFEYPGRVSDSGTVAGNYASRFAAVSCTGVGEEIVDDAVSARLETRCRDGMSLAKASELCFKEAQECKRDYGWIALDNKYSWSIAHTTPFMTYAVITVDQEVLASSLL